METDALELLIIQWVQGTARYFGTTAGRRAKA